MNARTPYHKFLSQADVCDLGLVLAKIAHQYPLSFRTERDFFPLVATYLEGRVPRLQMEVSRIEGNIDFRVGGNNPALLELAVAPRALVDPNDPSVLIAGHRSASQLYAAANKTELVKLAAAKEAKARYVLLLDLRGGQNLETLERGYRKALPSGAGHQRVTVVNVDRRRDPVIFAVGGKQRSRQGGS